MVTIFEKELSPLINEVLCDETFYWAILSEERQKQKLHHLGSALSQFKNHEAYCGSSSFPQIGRSDFINPQLDDKLHEVHFAKCYFYKVYMSRSTLME